MKRIIIIIFSICLFYNMGIRFLLSELEFMNYKRALVQCANEKSFSPEKIDKMKYHLEKSLKYDPDNTWFLVDGGVSFYKIVGQIELSANYLDKAALTSNGDVVPWSIWYNKGLYELSNYYPYKAKSFFEKSMLYNPNFEPSIDMYRQVDDILDGRTKP